MWNFVGTGVPYILNIYHLGNGVNPLKSGLYGAKFTLLFLAWVSGMVWR